MINTDSDQKIVDENAVYFISKLKLFFSDTKYAIKKYSKNKSVLVILAFLFFLLLLIPTTVKLAQVNQDNE